MKVTLLAESLREALTVASSAVMSRANYGSALTYVLLDATPDGGLVITGTDTETRAWHTVSAKVEAAGGVLLPPRVLSDFLDAVSDGEAVTITVDEKHKAEIVCGRTRARVAGLDPEQLPPAPDLSDPVFDLTLGADLFAGLVKSVAHAVAPDAARPTLSGIFVHVGGGELCLAAADGYRLAIKTLAVEDAADLTVIAQGKTLAKAASMIRGATSARLMVDANRSALTIDSEAGCWSIRLLDGDYPDFARIIPRDPPIAVTVARSDLLRAVKVVKGVEQTDVGHKIRLTITEDSIEVRASDQQEDREAETVIEATVERGEPLAIAFRNSHVHDAVDAIMADQITLELSGPDKPGLIRAAVEPDGGTQVLMPLAVARP